MEMTNRKQIKRRKFNTTGICVPWKHYMVDLSERLEVIREMIADGKYFLINRGRQYGKSTTLAAVSRIFQDEYAVLNLDFQGLGAASFETEQTFCRSFAGKVLEKEMYGKLELPEGMKEAFREFTTRGDSASSLADLFDEVDNASNSDVFVDFLAQLREGYIARDAAEEPAIHSVVLAGVTDIRYLKRKIRDDSQAGMNSPWNIAAQFDLDLSLQVEGIQGMLSEYEADHQTGMDVAAMAEEIRNVTGGYPFLVSRICQILDEEMVPGRFAGLSDAWTDWGVQEAVKNLMYEKNALFGSLMSKVENFPELRKKLREMLLYGSRLSFNVDDNVAEQLLMYGFIRKEGTWAKISNRIFEMRLYRYFVDTDMNTEDGSRFYQIAASQAPAFVVDGQLDLPLILEHFVQAYGIINKDRDRTRKFLEEEARERFLLYISPIINGTGTYSIEEQTRDGRRMDVVIHFLGKRYVVELKIWHGERYNEKGEEQIKGYLDYFGLDTGYMVSFNFNQKKEPGVERWEKDGKVLFEAVV